MASDIKIVGLIIILALCVVTGDLYSQVYKAEVEDWLLKDGTTLPAVADPVNYSGGHYLEVQQARAAFDLPDTAIYRAWLRYRSDSEDSFTVNISGTLASLPLTLNQSWRWINLGTVTGTATVELVSAAVDTGMADVIAFAPDGAVDPETLLAGAITIVPTGVSLGVTLPYDASDSQQAAVDSYNNIYLDGDFFLPVNVTNPSFPAASLHGANINRGLGIYETVLNYEKAHNSNAYLSLQSPGAPYSHFINNELPDFLNLPALLAWNIGDPIYGQATSHNIASVIGTSDPDHPLAVDLSGEKADYAQHASFTDMMLTGRAGHGASMWDVARGIDEVRSAVNDAMPVGGSYWIYSQGGLADGDYATVDEVRCATYVMLIHGAKAFQYYDQDLLWNNDIYWGGGPLPTWDDISAPWDELGAVLREVHYLEPVIEAPYPEQLFSITQGGSSIDAILKVAHGDAYIIAANMTQSIVSGRFDISLVVGSYPYSVGAMFEDEGNNRIISVGSDEFLDSFGPLETHVYHIDGLFPIVIAEESPATRLARISAWLGRYSAPSPLSITVQSPTTASTYVSAGPEIMLGGTASALSSFGIMKWSNNRGPEGEISWQTSWSSDTISLSEGVNEITVSVLDAPGAEASDTISIIYAASSDGDVDGLTDVWEYSYFGHNVMLGGDDPDTDGATNSQEEQAGTDPTDPDDFPVQIILIEINTVNPQYVYITWSTAPAATYTILWTDELDTGWNEVSGPALGDIVDNGNGTSTWIDKGTSPNMGGLAPGSVPQRFYKIEELP